MQIAYKCTDLAPDDRAVVERLLGRPLHIDEAVEVIAHKLLDSSEVPREPWGSGDRIRDLATGKTYNGATVRQWIEEGRRS